MEVVIACCLECLKVLALVSFPVIPQTAKTLWRMLGFSDNLEKRRWREVLNEKMATHQILGETEILFKKVEDETIEREIAKLNGKQPEQKKMEQIQTTEISIEDFKKCDLKIGQILAVEKVPKSSKLLKLQVDLGTEKRTIVSGIALFFENMDELIGKKVVVVTNLKPVKLMGVESQGMILTAHIEGGIELLKVDHAAPGSSIS